MSKSLSLFFACLAIVFLSAMSISISYSIIWVIIFGSLSLLTIGLGFMVKAKKRKN